MALELYVEYNYKLDIRYSLGSGTTDSSRTISSFGILKYLENINPNTLKRTRQSRLHPEAR